MELNITGNQVNVGAKLNKHVEEGLRSSVKKYFADTISANVSFSKEGEQVKTEITVHPKKGLIVNGTGIGGDAYSAFDDANEHIAIRLRKHKTIINGHKGKSSAADLANYSVISNNEVVAEEEETEFAPITIAELTADIPVCSVSEAVMFMDLADTNAILFRNSSHGEHNMVYRRKDGNIGWVDPKEIKK